MLFIIQYKTDISKELGVILLWMLRSDWILHPHLSWIIIGIILVGLQEDIFEVKWFPNSSFWKFLGDKGEFGIKFWCKWRGWTWSKWLKMRLLKLYCSCMCCSMCPVYSVWVTKEGSKIFIQMSWRKWTVAFEIQSWCFTSFFFKSASQIFILLVICCLPLRITEYFICL